MLCGYAAHRVLGLPFSEREWSDLTYDFYGQFCRSTRFQSDSALGAQVDPLHTLTHWDNWHEMIAGDKSRLRSKFQAPANRRRNLALLPDFAI
jgi:hypothetical protein